MKVDSKKIKLNKQHTSQINAWPEHGDSSLTATETAAPSMLRAWGEYFGETFFGKLNDQDSGILEKLEKRPDVDDIASEEALERYKQYGLKSNLRANEQRMFAAKVSQFANYAIMGAFIAMVGAVGSALGVVGGVLAGTAVVGVAAAISLGSFYYLNQNATSHQTIKGNDMSDFHNKRNAKFIAKELKAELFGDKSFDELLDTPKNRVDVSDSVEETLDTAPSRQLH